MADENLVPKRQLSPRFDDALKWAAEIHHTQGRKADPGPSTIPYLAHLLSVAGAVLNAGGDETAAIGALLHDANEDGKISFAEIQRRAGRKVARIVRECTDTGDSGIERTRENSLPRKVAYLAHLAEPDALSDRSLLVALADKLDNVRSLVSDYRVVGRKVWCRFNVKGERVNLAYYWKLDTALGALASKDVAAERLHSDLHRAVEELIDLAGSPRKRDVERKWKKALKRVG